MSDSTQPASLLQRAGPPVAVALLTLLAFAPALGHYWMPGWDDDHNFLNNEAYRGLAWENVEWAFTTMLMGPYQPLSWLSLSVDHALWGMDARGYHLTNLLLHTACAVLVYALVLDVLRATRQAAGASADAAAPPRLAAAFGALVFAVHPLRVESVAWVTERRDVLSGVFFVATLIAYLRWTRTGSQRTYWGCVALFGAAMLSKGTGMLLPFALLVLDAYPLRRWRPGHLPPTVWLDKLPLLAVSAFTAVMALRGQASVGTLAEGLPLPVRIMVAATGLVFYPLATLFPVELSPLYEMGRPAWHEPRFIVALLLVLLVTYACWRRRADAPALLSSWLFYAIVAFPVLGLFQAGRQLAADRYTYLPLLPVAGLAAYGVTRLSRECLARLAAPAVIVASLGTLSFAQTRRWENPYTLWTHALRLDDARNSTGWSQLGLWFMHAEDYAAAETALVECVKLRPDHLRAWYNLGVTRGFMGDYDSALICFERALKIDPSFDDARTNIDAIRRAREEGPERSPVAPPPEPPTPR